MPKESAPKSIESKKSPIPGQSTSRRDFLKKMGILATGAPFVKIDNVLDIQEKTAQDWMVECGQIITNEQYEKILENPYLVFALYCSKAAVDKMARPPYEYPSEEIISNIYPLITREFRENYFNFLRNLIQERGVTPEDMEMERSYLPLDNPSLRGINATHPDAFDLFTDEGAPVYSIKGGIVVLVENGWNKEDKFSTSSMRGGNTVIVFDPQAESFYRYAHLQETLVQAGTILPSGTRIGIVGHTGVSASQPGHGGHLHLEINEYDKKEGIMKAVSARKLQERIKILQAS